MHGHDHHGWASRSSATYSGRMKTKASTIMQIRIFCWDEHSANSIFLSAVLPKVLRWWTIENGMIRFKYCYMYHYSRNIDVGLMQFMDRDLLKTLGTIDVHDPRTTLSCTLSKQADCCCSDLFERDQRSCTALSVRCPLAIISY